MKPERIADLVDLMGIFISIAKVEGHRFDTYETSYNCYQEYIDAGEQAIHKLSQLAQVVEAAREVCREVCESCPLENCRMDDCLLGALKTALAALGEG